jgi:hypothetical protein
MEFWCKLPQGSPRSDDSCAQHGGCIACRSVGCWQTGAGVHEMLGSDLFPNAKP